MKRFIATLTLATLAAAVLTLPLVAQDRPPVGMAERMGRPHAGGLMRCLRGLDLTDTQKADIKTVLEAAQPTIQADAAAVLTARQKLNADDEAGVDESVLGQDYINARTAGKKLHDDGAAAREQVLGKLTPDQKAKAQDCLDSHQGHGPGGMSRHFEG